MSSQIKLRPYQTILKNGICRSWADGHTVCAVSPTGSGKTVLMASLVSEQPDFGVVIAHRVELVAQISIALARAGVRHNIIAPTGTVKFCISQHIAELGRSFYQSGANATVAAVDTMNARAESLLQFFARVKWWMIDECHHVLVNNKWGTAVSRFPGARGLGVTATPIRADRKSLHVDQGGVFSDMVLGPTMRELIRAGSLCDYRIWAPPQSIDLSGVKVGSNGDFSAPGLRHAAEKSKIVGDVVEHYLRLAAGKRGITFTVDVDQAVKTAQAFCEAGVPALAISAKTPESVRAAAIQKFRAGSVLQLVNVDLFGEGFDVPAVECVSMARPTQSYSLFVQQFGRALRVLEGKPYGIVIDHVGNVMRHGLPDAPRQWSLLADERGKRAERDPDVLPVTTCVECFAAFEAVTKICPFCGAEQVPESRSTIEHVSGDLWELDAETLAQMRGEVERIDDEPLIPTGAGRIVEMSIRKKWRERQEAQAELRHAIAVWAGVWRDKGASDSEICRRFYFRFGVDVLGAQKLGAKPARELMERITS